ncbi:MAG: DUF3450 domain-containing protein [Pseudomonadota bacterium]
MTRVLTPARGVIAAALVVGLSLPAMAQSQLRNGLNTGEQATRQAERTQERINQLDDERSDLVREFRRVLQNKKAADINARQLEKEVESQRRELESLRGQLGRVDEIKAQTVPMLLDMIEKLELFVASDLQFKTEERQSRIQTLNDAMESPDVSIAERYRLIIEAYQAEMEYGRTVDTWTETVDIDGNEVLVDYFLYGRIALVRMSPDKRYAQRWERAGDGADGQWVDVENRFKDDIENAIRIAQGRTTPGLMYAPASKLSVN